MIIVKTQRICLYCGQPTKRGRKGEHIVPEAVGGALTLNDVSNRAVCPTCNSGTLSNLDKELCSRSFLSAVASQEIDAHLWQVWDVDHESNNLLVDARPWWGADGMLNSLVCYPQITFEQNGPAVRGDYEDCRRFGYEDFAKVLFKSARHCFDRYRAGERGALNFERVRTGVIHRGYRLAPRIFAPNSIFEIAKSIKKQAFVLRFVTPEEKTFALQSLSRLSDDRRSNKWARKPGSHYPTICFFFDAGDTLRALMKVGLNLIAAYCPNTPVTHESFRQAIRIIRDEAGQLPRSVLQRNGFVHVGDIQTIAAGDNAHSFRLVHIDKMWHIYSSFFGGKVGACVRVPGPNNENWRSADIVAPLYSKDWRIETSRLLYPMKVCVEWHDGTVVTPSFKLQNAMSSVSIECVAKTPPRR
jgi:hypothetical protein